MVSVRVSRFSVSRVTVKVMVRIKVSVSRVMVGVSVKVWGRVRG